MNKNKLFVLGLDGVPYTFLLRKIRSGAMPNLAKLAKASHFQAIDSVQPPVSSSAWASFLTGKQPHQHGILSFTERDPYTMDWFTPDARHLKTKTFVEELSEQGKRVFIMNVPVTYPAKPINGISICGFLGTDLKKGVYPVEETDFLINSGYKIDVDTELAKTDLAAFLMVLRQVLEKRIEVMWHYFDQENWDFFMTHIMETDRLFHFTWELMENNDPLISGFYEGFFRRIDDVIGRIMGSIDDNTTLMILSDHGFTTLKQEVYLNRWLWENDYLRFTKPVPQSLHDIHPQSKAYALYPGRIFINLKGREISGSVHAGTTYEKLRMELCQKLLRITLPGTSEKIINEVIYGEKLYPGSIKTSENVADLFAVAHDGYDIKGQLWNKHLFHKGIFNGMHSFSNAFLMIKGISESPSASSIADIYRVILRTINIEDRWS